VKFPCHPAGWIAGLLFPMLAIPLAAADPITLRPATATSHTFPNGFTLIVDEDHSAPVASVQMWCRTGSIHEDRWMGAGLSHILEHMLFKGTETRGANDIARAVQDTGGYINAYTSFDRTVYWIDTPSAGADNAADILADAMMNSTLPEAEYAKEQEVIRREFAMGFDNPDRTAHELLFATAYSAHPYRHPVIGYLDVYNRLTREDVLAYYRARYVPNNLFLVVVGDVDGKRIRERMAAFFEKHPRRALAPVFLPQEPAQIARREDRRSFPTELTRLHLAWHIPAVTHPDAPALDVLANILGSGRSSRLNRTVREERNLAHSIDAWAFTPSEPGLFGVDAVTDPGRRDAARAEALRQVGLVRDRPVTADELEKSRRMVLGAQLAGMTTVRGRASDLGSSWLTTRTLDFTRSYVEAMQRVTAADVQRVARDYLRDDKLTEVSVDPPSKSAMEPRVAVEAPGGVHRFELSNGLRLLVREDPRLPLVSAVAVFRGGLLAESPANNGITELLSRTLLKGTATRSAEQIARMIEGAGGSIDSDAGNNSWSVSVGVMKPDLALGLDLLADVVRNASFPEKEVAIEKEGQLAGIKAEEDQPTAVARNLMRATLFGSHPYGMRSLGTPETVTSLDSAALRAFHARTAVAEQGVIAVFGNVRSEEVRELVERRFSSLRKAGGAAEPPPVPDRIEKTLEAAGVQPKNQAILMVAYPGVDLANPDRFALELIEEASSDLGSRFFIRIREELGLAYFVGASQFVGVVPGVFNFYLGTDPKKLEPVREAFLDEIGKLASDGLTAAELERAKAKLLGQEEIQIQSNAAYAQASALDELYGLGFDFRMTREKRVRAVTLEEVRDVARRYLGGPGRVIASIHPPPAPDQPDKEPAKE